MPNPERVEKKQDLTKEEQALSDVREELASFVDRFQVENILSELNIFINPLDL
jgi:cellobiose phosphorylase